MSIEVRIGGVDIILGITRDDIRDVLEASTPDTISDERMAAAIEEVMDHTHNLDLGELAEFIIEQSGVTVEEDE